MQLFREKHPEQRIKDREYTRSHYDPEVQRAYRLKNKDRIKEQSRIYNRKKLLAKYGLTPGQFEEILASQGYVCAICGKGKAHKKNWHVDHDHKTNEVRAILCGHCNIMLGQAREDPTILEAGALYLRTFSGK